MFNAGDKAQAAIELAVFGAILIFIWGTILRSATGTSYEQNQEFKAMRMALLASWKGTIQNPAGNHSEPDKVPQVIARNSAQILFVEDRLSPDNGKYGSLERNPFMASGSGTFTYNLYYPITGDKGDLQPDDIHNSLPIMDVYINGQ